MMFVKINLSCKSHKNPKGYQNKDLMQYMHVPRFSIVCIFIFGNLFLPMIMAFGQEPHDQMIHEDIHFHKRLHHRQQTLSLKRRSIQSNNAAERPLSALNSINAEDANKPPSLGPGSSTGRPAVCASCMDRELYRNLTLQEIKKDILKKLKMDKHGPPQVSRKDFDEHMMGQIVDRYRKTHQHIDQFGTIQRDEASHGGLEDDNEFATCNQVTVLAQKREYIKSLLPFIIGYYYLSHVMVKNNVCK